MLHVTCDTGCGRKMLIFEGAICKHLFYRAVCCADLKTVFVLKIGTILVVRSKIYPPPPSYNEEQ